jgi:hypothetical protein
MHFQLHQLGTDDRPLKPPVNRQMLSGQTYRMTPKTVDWFQINPEGNK